MSCTSNTLGIRSLLNGGAAFRLPFCWSLGIVLCSVWLWMPTVFANDKLLVGVYHAPPKLFINDQGELRGIMGELLTAIATEERWSLETRVCEFQQCLMLLEQGEIDLVPDIAWSEERARRFAFHQEPVMHSWSQLYQREGLPIDAILDLEHMRVAVVDGSVQQTYLAAVTDRFNISVMWVPVNSFSEGFEAVSHGDADVVASNYLFGEWRAHDYGLRETPIIFQPTRLFYAASPRLSQTVLDSIDAALQQWKQDPSSIYFETLRSWRLQTPSEPLRTHWSWWGGGVVLVFIMVLVGGMFFKRRLKPHRGQLGSSDAVLGTILEKADVCIYIKSPTLEYRYVNQKVCELFGLPAEKIIGKRDDVFFCRSSATAINQLDREVLAKDKQMTAEEHRVLQGEEQERTFLSIKMPLMLGNEKVPGLLGISTELTDDQEMQPHTHPMAFYDVLTGLPNRRFLMESLVTATVQETDDSTYSAVLLIDLDNFRLVNDIQGHESGDQLLINVAQQLHQCLSQEASVARFSSDEFVVLLDTLGEQQSEAAHRAERIAQQVLDAISALPNDRALPVSASIGITLFKSLDISVNGVLQQADMALQQAKAAGGNTLRFFNLDMQTSVLERATLEGDLHQAMARKELALHYQTQVDHRGVTVGVEALLRWHHPQRGWVFPSTFIPLAEENGLIVPIGYWVLESACEQLAVWSNHSAYSALTISVNVSSVQFQQPEFVRQIEGLLAQTQAPPGRLVLEVTESLLMREPTRVRNTMLKLRAQGIRFALDDFGTGYSSLSYLKRLPLDELKIDQSFIRELLTDKTDAAIVDTTILLASSLGLTVVAEGVEKQEQLNWLKGHGCYRYQGALFGKPVPIDCLFQDH